MNKLNKKNISKLLDKFKIVCYNIDTVKEIPILNIKSVKTIKQKGKHYGNEKFRSTCYRY